MRKRYSNSSKINSTTLTLIVAIGGSTLVGSAAYSDEKMKFLSTPDNEITAYFVGPKCADQIEMLFQATDPKAFDEETTPASRLMANATRVLPRQCEQLKRVVSKGAVGDRILYNGIAEAQTEWRLTELGVRTSAGVLSGETSDAGQKAEFAGDAGFSPFQTLSPNMSEKSYCVRPDEAGDCAGEASFTDVSPDAATVTARYLLNEDGTEASLLYPASNADGFLCTPTQDVEIGVSGGELTEEGRSEYAEMLRERVESGGDQVCTGFQNDSSGELLMGTFDASGRSMGEHANMRETPGDVSLRLDD